MTGPFASGPEATNGAPGPVPQVFVSVGTDHHPFDRLVTWVDAWIGGPGAGRASCFVQSGTSMPPRLAHHRDYLRYDEMEEAFRSSVAVVCHGGPATIMDARRLGKLPIVVPRRSGLGEHVDDHQVAFTSRLAAAGDIHLPRTEVELAQLLERALVAPAEFHVVADGGAVAAAVARFDELVAELVARPRSGRLAGLNLPSPGSLSRTFLSQRFLRRRQRNGR